VILATLVKLVLLAQLDKLAQKVLEAIPAIPATPAQPDFKAQSVLLVLEEILATQVQWAQPEKRAKREHKVQKATLV
jgi:hypothetical protein